MAVTYTVFMFIIGLFLGSFYNVVGLRVPKKETFVTGRSYCPKCKKTLSWYELIPVLSFLFLRGKCRKCGAKIAWIYPAIELMTGVMFAFSYYKIGFSLELLLALSFVSMLMIIFVSDISYMLIPDKVLLFFLPIFIILRILLPFDPWWSPIVGAIASFLLIALIIIVSKGGMGAGDMKLFGLLGIVLGLKHVFLAFFLACLIGTIIGGIQMLRKRVKKGEPIPFGPSIVLAALITYFYGDLLISFYMQLF